MADAVSGMYTLLDQDIQTSVSKVWSCLSFVF